MFKRFLIAILIFLIAVVIAADRVGAIVGAHVLASKVQTDEHLPNRPSAHIGGIPFLTQASNGKYSDVKITAHEVPVNAVDVTTLTANLRGVHLPLSKIVGGSVSTVPVDNVDGSAFVSFADANDYLAKHEIAGQKIQVGRGPNGEASVIDIATVAGHKFTLKGFGTVGVTRNVVSVDVSTLTGAANRVVDSVLSHINVSLPLSGLPFRMRITKIAVTDSGFFGAASASNITLGSGH